MRSRLLIAIALAAFGAALTAGAVGAKQGKLLDVGGADLSIDLPGGGKIPDVRDSLPACSNLKDDDGDGKTDLGDPDCNGALDSDEAGPAPPAGGGAEPGGESVQPGGQPENTQPGDTGDQGGQAPRDQEPAGPPANDPDGGNGGDGDGKKGGGQGDSGGGKKGGDRKGDDKGGKNKKGKNKGGKNKKGEGGKDEPAPKAPPPPRRSNGKPTRSNPSVSIVEPGAAPIGVPNFLIDQFTIPPFLLSIYHACGTQYGIPWQILASINRIETAFGTNLNVSSAGAVGWMQFLPSSWRAYGVDANGDGRKDPYNPLDAICSAARYLNAAGAEEDMRGAIFAYNHADWYVDEVLLYARQYGKLPEELVGSLTGLTEGARFPVAARARYADDISERQARKRSRPRQGQSGNAADVIASSPTRRGINIFAREGAPVVAVNDGVIKRIGRNDRLGRFVVLEDAFGNRFTYAGLGELAKVHPVPKERDLDASDFELVTPGKGDEPPSRSATGAGEKADGGADGGGEADGGDDGERANRGASAGPPNTEDARQRLYAYPERPNNVDRADLTGQLDDLLGERLPGYETFKAFFSDVLELDPKTHEARPLREGSRVQAGTLLGRIGAEEDGVASHVNFAIKPAGRGAPKIDPKPILDGWKLLESTAIYRASGESPFVDRASVGQVLLASKSQLTRRVLADPRLEIYSCGRRDVRSGQIDRRILATLEYLAERGFRLTVTSLKCGHSVFTKSGNISHHSTGNAVDIAAINGRPVLGNQGKGSITEALIRDVLQLQGTMEPAQVISLMELGGPTFAMSDHADHVHIGFTPPGGEGSSGEDLLRALRPSQWERLVERLGEIEQPRVPTNPSKYSLPARKAAGGGRSSNAHRGE